MGRKKRIPNPDEPPIPRKPRTRLPVGITKRKPNKVKFDPSVGQVESIMGYGVTPKPISLKTKSRAKKAAGSATGSARPKKPEGGMAEFIWQERFDAK
jgi:hypothetical protein